jgi:hypothetical protein
MMLVVNIPAKGQTEGRFWCQKVPVVAGKMYKLAVRARAAVPSVVDSQPTQITFTVNGANAMAEFPLERDWVEYKAVGIPAEAGTIDFCGEARTQNTESTDLIMDDVLFAECRTQ